jgi:hypothetical protein
LVRFGDSAIIIADFKKTVPPNYVTAGLQLALYSGSDDVSGELSDKCFDIYLVFPWYDHASIRLFSREKQVGPSPFLGPLVGMMLSFLPWTNWRS